MRITDILTESIKSSYFKQQVPDSVGASDIYYDFNNIKLYKMKPIEDMRREVYLIVGERDGDLAYGYITNDNGYAYSIDDKIYYDFKNVDDRIEDLLDF